jgi:hypothetical protein
MKEGYKYILTSDGQERQIDFVELNNLKKDILWIFDENTNDLPSAFVPRDSFRSKYWEYLSLEGDKWFYEKERRFYRTGVMIILIFMTLEFIDTESGDQKIFGETKVNEIINYVESFKPMKQDEDRLKLILLNLLSIANSMTISDLSNKDFTYPGRDEVVTDLKWVDETFIKFYFRGLL